jgi:antitoxin (DNA-binding transcriptional repressor) of toxin-antitoxin stability system
MAVVTAHAAKTNLSQLLERAEAGEESVIARGPTPAAKCVPIDEKPTRQFGPFAGRIPVRPGCCEPPEDETRRRREGRGDDPSCRSGGA